MSFAQLVCKTLEAQGYWADYIDPCSGLPVCIKSMWPALLTVTAFKVTSIYDPLADTTSA